MMWAMLLLSCGAKGSASKENGDTSVRAESLDSAVVTIPAFNADSAYAYVARQVAFGPHVPQCWAHAGQRQPALPHRHRHCRR